MTQSDDQPQWLADLVREVALWKARRRRATQIRRPRPRPRTTCTVCGKNVGTRLLDDGVVLPWLHQPYPGQPRIHFTWCPGVQVPIPVVA